MKLTLGLLLTAILSLSLAGCGVQSIPQAKNAVESSLAEMDNQYKRRADLIPNLVETVKGFAKQESDVLVGVTEARAKATSINIDPSKSKPEDLVKYQQAQGELSQALGRLMMITENYPQLKSDQNFRDLQVQLEGTENRITVARQRYIETIRQFNDLVTVFPTSLTNSIFYKHEKMAQWTAPEGEAIQTAPKVGF
jgi:LemA protein